MQLGFPSPEKNALLRQITADPRSRKKSQEHPEPPKLPPTQYRRVAGRSLKWDLPRSLPCHHVEQDTGIGGKATKWAIRNQSDPEDFYIAKFGNKNGRIEVITELFNNQLGLALGCKMAHSGLARLDGDLYFLTHNFRRSEDLIHGSLVVAEVFGTKDPEQVNQELAAISAQHQEEQAFWRITFVKDTLDEYCRSDAGEVFTELVEMLVFDALIGSMDRHPKNWGVLRSQVPALNRQTRFRLAPIFDSARALMWDFPEARLLRMDLDEEILLKYLHSSRPCIGPAFDSGKSIPCNHFELISNLLEVFPHQTLGAYDKIKGTNIEQIAAKLLRQFPFSRAFSSLRKRLILKVLRARADTLRRIFEEGGADEPVGQTHAITLLESTTNIAGGV